MKKFTDFLLFYLAIMCNLIELLMAPLIFATVGLIYDVRGIYYLITIGGYLVLMVIWEVLGRLYVGESGKVFHCPMVRVWKKIMARLSESNETPTEDN